MKGESGGASHGKLRAYLAREGGRERGLVVPVWRDRNRALIKSRRKMAMSEKETDRNKDRNGEEREGEWRSAVARGC